METQVALQLPYLISGGLFGLALVIVGATAVVIKTVAAPVGRGNRQVAVAPSTASTASTRGPSWPIRLPDGTQSLIGCLGVDPVPRAAAPEDLDDVIRVDRTARQGDGEPAAASMERSNTTTSRAR